MKQVSVAPAGRAGDYAYIFRGRGWHIVPTREMKWENRIVSRPAHSAPLFTDDITFAQWFGPRGTYRNASHIGVLTGAVSGGLYVFEVNMVDPKAVTVWETMAARLGLNLDAEFAAMTDDNYLRTFLKFHGPSHPPRGVFYPGITIFGDGDFVSIPTLTLEDIKREGGVH